MRVWAKALARPRNGHVHQTPFFLDTVFRLFAVFVREQAFFEAGDKDRVKLQSFSRVHRHQLHRILPGLGLIVARFERGMREKGG